MLPLDRSFQIKRQSLQKFESIQPPTKAYQALRRAFLAICFVHALSKAAGQKNIEKTKALVEKISSLELPFSANDFLGLESNPSQMILSGKIPIIVSAPHAVSQLRYGKLKPSDAYTGAFSLALHNDLKCHAMIKSKYDGTDPNTQSGQGYRDALSNHIKANQIGFVLDLHCMHPSRSEDIILGTNNSKNLLGHHRIIPSFTSAMNYYGITQIRIDKNFTASSQYNISRNIAETLHIPCLQVEINLHSIHPNVQPQKMRNIYRGLLKFMQEFDKFLS